MAAAEFYALAFTLLGAWGVFTWRKSFKLTGPWAQRRWYLFLVELLFAGSCFACAAALGFDWFRAWLLAPLGASFLGMIPLPCYFDAVDRIRWLHAARNLLFLAVAALCLALAFGFVPLARFGL